ncbi:MAG TPA: DUF6412 domain-containing protein [Nocardiopsis listeri]|uniref:DUF6412 domain-containing protein n=1 Tax=Nocardiopsis listeri TaxID=53440 RepID=UPI001D35E3B9|nr:DUF6412 domain-containing protein [Nocardiopsis listeri]HJE59534.1 DUF6412 domain-containing protein [Nocardiopsis listeri]
MHYLIPLFDFLLLGVLPTELLDLGTQGPALVLVAVAVGAALTWMVLRGTALWPVGDSATGAGHAMRRRSARLPVLTLRDPDAAGRPRPRAPGRALPAAL